MSQFVLMLSITGVQTPGLQLFSFSELYILLRYKQFSRLVVSDSLLETVSRNCLKNERYAYGA